MDIIIGRLVAYCFPEDNTSLSANVSLVIEKYVENQETIKPLALMCFLNLLEGHVECNETVEIYYKLIFKEPLDILQVCNIEQDPEFSNRIEKPFCFKDDVLFMKMLMERNLNDTSEVCITVTMDHTKIELDEQVVLEIPHPEGQEFSDEAAVYYGKMAFRRKIEFVVFGIQADPPRLRDEVFIRNLMKSLNDKFPCETPKEWGHVFAKKTAHVYHKFTKMPEKGVLYNAFLANPNWEIPCEEDYRIFIL